MKKKFLILFFAIIFSLTAFTGCVSEEFIVTELNSVVVDGEADLDTFKDTFTEIMLTNLVVMHLITEQLASAGTEVSEGTTPDEAFDLFFASPDSPFNEGVSETDGFHDIPLREWLDQLEEQAPIEFHPAIRNLPLDDLHISEILEGRMADADFMARFRISFPNRIEAMALEMDGGGSWEWNSDDFEFDFETPWAEVPPIEAPLSEFPPIEFPPAEFIPPLETPLPTDVITVIVNGSRVVFPDQQPEIVDGRTLVPTRGVFESLGFNVHWVQATRTVLLSSDTTRISVAVDSHYIEVEHASQPPETILLDVPSQIIGGRTMLPLRSVAEATGAEVTWDAATRTINIAG
jgi:hypothetical protein